MDEMAAVDELRKVALFKDVGLNALTSLAQACQWRRIPQKRPVILQGDPGNSIYLIVEGRVEVTKWNSMGDAVFLAERGPGDHFGEMSLFHSAPRSANVTTLTECKLLVLERAPFFHAMRSNPDLAMGVILALAQRLREADEQRGSRDSARDRLVAYLRREGERQSGGPMFKGSKVHLELSRAEIAERLATSRETVSRELSALEARGAVSISGRNVIVLQPDKLR